MNITEAQYVKNKLLDTVIYVKATIGGQENNVPLAPDNADYAEILKQVKAGTLTIKDAD